MQIKRQDFLNEIKQEMELRKTIRHAIRFSEAKRLKEENTLRQIIRKLILEGTSKVKVHDTTAGNFLEHLFTNTNFLDELRSSYHALRTSPEQRKSYAAHILHAMEALLSRDKLNRQEDDEAASEETSLKATPETGFDLNITDKESKQERELEAEHEEKFKMIPGMDETGAGAAERSWAVLEKLITNELTITFDPRDWAQFSEYLIFNTTSYFKEWEEKIQAKEAKKVEASPL
jgi:hypothetical protein